MRKVTLFNQGDGQWTGEPLGKSGLSMGGYGCYTTTVLMGLVSFFIKKAPDGTELDPGKFAKMLSDVNGYDADGQIIWGAISWLFPNVRLYGREWTTNHPQHKSMSHVLTVEKAIADIRTANLKGQVVGICVERNSFNTAKPDHLVLALDTPEDLDEWTIADPDGGVAIRFTERYGSPLTGIYGYRTLVGIPARYPDESTLSDKQAGKAVGFAVDDRYTKNDILNILMSA